MREDGAAPGGQCIFVWRGLRGARLLPAPAAAPHPAPRRLRAGMLAQETQRVAGPGEGNRPCPATRVARCVRCQNLSKQTMHPSEDICFITTLQVLEIETKVLEQEERMTPGAPSLQRCAPSHQRAAVFCAAVQILRCALPGH